jgi:hypothetical protein
MKPAMLGGDGTKRQTNSRIAFDQSIAVAQQTSAAVHSNQVITLQRWPIGRFFITPSVLHLHTTSTQTDSRLTSTPHDTTTVHWNQYTEHSDCVRDAQLLEGLNNTLTIVVCGA